MILQYERIRGYDQHYYVIGNKNQAQPLYIPGQGTLYAFNIDYDLQDWGVHTGGGFATIYAKNPRQAAGKLVEMAKVNHNCKYRWIKIRKIFYILGDTRYIRRVYND